VLHVRAHAILRSSFLASGICSFVCVFFCVFFFFAFLQEKAAARAANLADSKLAPGAAASSSAGGDDGGSVAAAVATAPPVLTPEEQWQQLLKLLQPQRLTDAPTLQVNTSTLLGAFLMAMHKELLYFALISNLYSLIHLSLIKLCSSFC